MNNKNLAALILSLLFLMPTLSSTISAQSPSGTPNTGSHNRYQTMQGTVEVCTQRAITVRDAQQMYVVRTFSFDAKLLSKMQKRHYLKGDHVKVKFIRGTDVAVDVK
ncbi:MAG: hypothetical protein LAO31_08090 [Acidobacteriia bacterium]|nr:hypothetical protein [Terriglobia bacterium]